jgi:hypothetical protein
MKSDGLKRDKANASASSRRDRLSSSRHAPQSEIPVTGNSITTRQTLPTWLKIVLSILVSVQLLAVFAEPFRFFTRSSQRAYSPDASVFRDLLSPYIDFAYLHHGYFFFAPNPGPSHLISARVGSSKPPLQSEEILIPDKKRQWPRLYYHRHFMLSEFLHNLFTPPEKPIEAERDREIELQWKESRDMYLSAKTSIENHLRTTYGTDALEVKRIEHLLPNDIQVFVEHWRLDDKRLYVELPERLPTDPNAAPSSTPLQTDNEMLQEIIP